MDWQRYSNPQEGRIRIEYDAVPNERGKDYGWLPIIWINGRRYGSTYSSSGYDKDEAGVLARRDAKEEADRYVGDWDVTITKR